MTIDMGLDMGIEPPFVVIDMAYAWRETGATCRGSIAETALPHQVIKEAHLFV